MNNFLMRSAANAVLLQWECASTRLRRLSTNDCTVFGGIRLFLGCWLQHTLNALARDIPFLPCMRDPISRESCRRPLVQFLSHEQRGPMEGSFAEVTESDAVWLEEEEETRGERNILSDMERG